MTTNCTVTQACPIPEIDTFLGCFSFFCTLVGTPLNLLSFFMFRNQKRSANYLVHMVIALCDSWISFNGYPYAVTMLSGNRQPLLFSDKVFRTLWAMTWDPFIFFSIYLVLVLSVLRTVKLACRVIVVQERHVVVALVAYATFLLTRVIVAVSFLGEFLIPDHNAYPYFEHRKGYPTVELYLSIACLIFPPIPIVTSALVSAFVLRSRRNQQSKNRKLRHQATVTVLMFTGLYLICNIPVLLAAIRFLIMLATNFKRDIFRKHGDTTPVFLKHYLWPITYLVLVQTNALLNPLVYFIRMSWFRKGVQEMFVRRGLMTAAVAPHDTVDEVSRGGETSFKRTVGSERVCVVMANPVRGGTAETAEM